MTTAGRVLIVDDEALVLSTLALHLRAREFTTQTAASGPGALREIRDSAFDLIVLDLRARNGQGIQILREVRALGLWTPVIVLAGYGMTPVAVEAVRLGAEFRERPVDPDEFIETAKRMIGDYRRVDARVRRSG